MKSISKNAATKISKFVALIIHLGRSKMRGTLLFLSSLSYYILKIYYIDVLKIKMRYIFKMNQGQFTQVIFFELSAKITFPMTIKY